MLRALSSNNCTLTTIHVSQCALGGSRGCLALAAAVLRIPTLRKLDVRAWMEPRKKDPLSVRVDPYIMANMLSCAGFFEMLAGGSGSARVTINSSSYAAVIEAGAATAPLASAVLPLPLLPLLPTSALRDLSLEFVHFPATAAKALGRCFRPIGGSLSRLEVLSFTRCGFFGPAGGSFCDLISSALADTDHHRAWASVTASDTARLVLFRR